MFNAADKWLKLESLQIDKLQFFIIGKISFIGKLSKGTQWSLNFDCNISFKIICSSLFWPVAKKNLHFLIFNILSIKAKNILAGTRFVGPEPPIPRRILVSSLLIWNFSIVFEIVKLSICILTKA